VESKVELKTATSAPTVSISPEEPTVGAIPGPKAEATPTNKVKNCIFFSNVAGPLPDQIY
jgi:hypothetical protein